MNGGLKEAQAEQAFANGFYDGYNQYPSHSEFHWGSEDEYNNGFQAGSQHNQKKAEVMYNEGLLHGFSGKWSNAWKYSNKKMAGLVEYKSFRHAYRAGYNAGRDRRNEQ
jgi:hypothetical protein